MKSRASNIQALFFSRINPVIRLLILSDILIVGATAMFGPLFALFVEDFITGETPIVVSIAMGLFLVSRSLLQIPAAVIIDKVKGEADDYWLMLVFSFLMALVPLLYLIIDTPVGLYAVQVLLGLFTAITYPSYMAIFTRHIDNQHEGTEWGMYFTLTDLGSAALAIIAGFWVERFGFPALIVLTSGISLLGTTALIPVRAYMKK